MWIRKKSMRKNLTSEVMLRILSISDLKSRDCVIRSLSMPSISCCTRPHVFISFARLKIKFNSPSVAGEWWRQVNKTQRISAKIDRFRFRLIRLLICSKIQQLTFKLRGHEQHFSSTRSKQMLQFFRSKFYLWPHICRIFHPRAAKRCDNLWNYVGIKYNQIWT